MNTPTKPVEQKARELLAAECNGVIGTALRNGDSGYFAINSMVPVASALRAIIAALNTDEER